MQREVCPGTASPQQVGSSRQHGQQHGQQQAAWAHTLLGILAKARGNTSAMLVLIFALDEAEADPTLVTFSCPLHAVQAPVCSHPAGTAVPSASVSHALAAVHGVGLMQCTASGTARSAAAAGERGALHWVGGQAVCQDVGEQSSLSGRLLRMGFVVGTACSAAAAPAAAADETVVRGVQ